MIQMYLNAIFALLLVCRIWGKSGCIDHLPELVNKIRGGASGCEDRNGQSMGISKVLTALVTIESPDSRVFTKKNIEASRTIKGHTKYKPIPVKVKVSKSLAKEEEASIASRQKMILSTSEMVISVGSFIATRFILKLDYANPKILKLSRMFFVAYIVAMQLLYLFIAMKLRWENDGTIVLSSSLLTSKAMTRLAEQFGLPPSLLSTLKIPGASSTPQTAREYDTALNKRTLQSVFFEVLMVSYLHLVAKQNAPLVLIPFMGLCSKLKEPLVALHIFQFRPVGDLQRPFKSSLEGMLEQILGGGKEGKGGEGEGVAGAGKEVTVIDSKLAGAAEEEVVDLDEAEKKGVVEGGEAEGGEEGERVGEEEGQDEEEEVNEKEIEELLDSLDVFAQEKKSKGKGGKAK